jgi:CBS domain-containing protein
MAKKKNQRIRDVMTPEPTTIHGSAMVVEAARVMREADIGVVIVTDNGAVHGLLTDRDIVVRAIAEGRDPAGTRVADVCSHEITHVQPNDAVDEATRIMREKAVRRLPVVEDGRPVGIVTLGDLAIERDRDSVLGEISAAPANR